MDAVRVFDDQPFGKVVLGDCVSAMNDLTPGSADLIFADPPYNLQLTGELRRPNHTKVSGVSETWDQFSNFSE